MFHIQNNHLILFLNFPLSKYSPPTQSSPQLLLATVYLSSISTVFSFLPITSSSPPCCHLKSHCEPIFPHRRPVPSPTIFAPPPRNVHPLHSLHRLGSKSTSRGQQSHQMQKGLNKSTPITAPIIPCNCSAGVINFNGFKIPIRAPIKINATGTSMKERKSFNGFEIPVRALKFVLERKSFALEINAPRTSMKERKSFV